MLRLAEEVLLLILDNERGDIAFSLEPRSLNVVLAGAVLMDLALENRIDTDLERLTVTDAAPVGDDLLDPFLADIAKEPGAHAVSHWLERIALQGEEIRPRALASLVKRGILESDDADLFFFTRKVSRSRRYPAVDDTATEEVQGRIMRLLFSDDIPDPRDVVIVSLAASCDLFRCILSREELAMARERIELISGLDVIGRSVAHALRQMKPPPRPPARPPEEIPKVSGWPLAGSSFEIVRDLESFLVRQYRELGPIFQFHAFNRHFIVLAGPEANRFVQRQGRVHLRSGETWHGFGNALGAKDVLVGMDGPAHVRLRKTHTRAFSREFIESRLDEVVAITRRVIAEWPRNQPIGVQSAMETIIVEQIALLTTGVSARHYLDDLTAVLHGLLKVHVMHQRPGWTLRLPRQRRARKRLEELYEKLLDHQRGEGRRQRNLIDDLLELHESDRQFLPETNLMAVATGPFLVGIDTSASTAAFMLYALVKHPELLARMTAEADDFFGRERLTAEGLRALDVTQRVVLETLRRYPVASPLMRTVANSFDFAGYTVPIRATVLIASTVAHHLPEYFPEPERFDIERYAPERAEHLQPGVFTPFGLGTHRCLGSHFAETQIALTLLTILREVEPAASPAGYELKIKRVLAPCPAPSFKVSVQDRRGDGQPGPA